MRRTQTLFVAIVGLPLLTGCQLLATQERRRPMVETSVDIVDVGGAVESPGAVEIPATGLTLAQAITRAGFLRAEKSSSDDWFVSLRRTHRGRPSTYLLPLAMVNQDVAGNMPMQNGDMVQVIPFESTRLARNLGGGTAEKGVVELRGLIPAPGRYEAKEFQSLIGKEDGGGNPLANGATVATLTRVSGLTTEHYMLPLADTPGTSPGLLAASTKHGDTITFTRVERIPIVISGLIEGVRRSAAERTDELSRRGERRVQRQSESSSIPGVDSLRSAGRTVRGLLPF
jgi:hypothetical protein